VKIKYNDLQEAVEFFGLIGLETKEQIKQKYLELSKRYHPDKENGNIDDFQKLNKMYKILDEYIKNFKFQFTKEEFSNQYPLVQNKQDKWSLW